MQRDLATALGVAVVLELTRTPAIAVAVAVTSRAVQAAIGLL